jgi:predicted Zn-dependent protease
MCLVLARLAEARGDDEGAAAAFALALASVDDPEARLRRALALNRLGRKGEATVELERVRVDRPTDALARGRLAELYEAVGRSREAEAELRWLADLQPERAAGWDRLARFYERGGRHREAREAADRARAASGARPERALRPLLPSRS